MARVIASGWRLRFALVLALALSMGCTQRALPVDEAVAEGRKHAPPGAVLVLVRNGPLSDFADARTLPEVPRSRLVWAIDLRAQYPRGCPAGIQIQCPPPPITNGLVVLDYVTGEFLYSEVPSPI